MSQSARDIYEHDAGAPPDDEFEAGTLARLVAGNRGRMLDPRRTAVSITGVDASRGMFGLRVEAFEDAGARWDLPLEDVSHLQFELGAASLTSSAVDDLEQAVAKFDRTIEIPANKEARTQTLQAVEHQRDMISAELAARPELRDVDLQECVRTRQGSVSAFAALDSLIAAAGLGSMEQSFAETYVSNPGSGEIVKGHSMVIAEMGLCSYSGKIVRDERLFRGDGTKERRRAHIVLRLAFMQELMAMLSVSTVELYRGMAIDGPLEPQRLAPLIASTFSREVATSHFESMTRTAVLTRQRVPAARLFMTFLETRAMNDRYKEAEAVLIGEPGNLAF